MSTSLASAYPSARPNMYNAKTVTLRRSEMPTIVDVEPDWGTIDPSPERAARPVTPRRRGSSLFDWGIALALVGMIGGATVMAGGTVLAATAVVLIKANPGLAMGAIGQAPEVVVAEAEPAVVAPTPEVAEAAPKATPTTKKNRPARTRAAQPARTAPVAAAVAAPPPPRGSDAQEMSVSQLRNHLSASAPAAAVAAPAAPALDLDDDMDYAAPAAAGSHGAADDADAELAALLNEPAPSIPTAAAPTPRPATGPARMSTRLSKARNGVLILDDPLDPVAVGITADGDAAIYVDGELLGGGPVAVVVDQGSHEVTIQAEKGTASFVLDAADGDKWCFTVKKEPKQVGCR